MGRRNINVYSEITLYIQIFIPATAELEMPGSGSFTYIMLMSHLQIQLMRLYSELMLSVLF